MNEKTSPQRILVGKVGLDGHDRGAKYVAHILRDAGFEVIYTGIRRSPEEIAETAVEEDVVAVGLSFLSGAHLDLTNRVNELLKAKGGGDIVVFVGGVIPSGDIPILIEMGVKEVFTPGTSAKDIIERIKKITESCANEKK
jgi:methylmalonyl-CoA mutase C-terminal domain/subunit